MRTSEWAQRLWARQEWHPKGVLLFSEGEGTSKWVGFSSSRFSAISINDKKHLLKVLQTEQVPTSQYLMFVEHEPVVRTGAVGKEIKQWGITNRLFWKGWHERSKGLHYSIYFVRVVGLNEPDDGKNSWGVGKNLVTQNEQGDDIRADNGELSSQRALIGCELMANVFYWMELRPWNVEKKWIKLVFYEGDPYMGYRTSTSS